MIFLQRQQRFIINLKRCILESLHEFFSMVVKFKNDIVSLTPERVLKIRHQRLEMHTAQYITRLDLTELLGMLISTIQPIFPEHLQF